MVVFSYLRPIAAAVFYVYYYSVSPLLRYCLNSTSKTQTQDLPFFKLPSLLVGVVFAENQRFVSVFNFVFVILSSCKQGRSRTSGGGGDPIE